MLYEGVSEYGAMKLDRNRMKMLKYIPGIAQ